MLTSRKTHRVVLLFIILALIGFFSQESIPAPAVDFHIYRTGTKFGITARWVGLSAVGTMEILGNTTFRGKDVILVRSRVTKVGGFMGFIVRFLRIYKGSNTFDSYIDTETLMTVRYEIYKLNKDGSKKINEDIYFDRDHDKIVSLLDNRIVASNVAPDIQDTFSMFLTLLRRINTEDLFVGKRFAANIYGYEEAFQVEIEVTRRTMRSGKAVYTMEIKELPAVFKHPASLVFEITDFEGEFRFPINAKCKIRVPAFPDISVKAKLREIERGDQ